MIKSLLIVSLGGALGASVRFLCYTMFSSGPMATWVVNGLGSFLLGFLTLYFHQRVDSDLNKTLILFTSVGFLGSFTTFSTLAGDIYGLLNTQWVKAVTLAVLQIATGVLLYFLGTKLCTLVFSP